MARKHRGWLDPYVQRNRTLRRLGYSNYGHYLASPLWASIRARAFRAKGYRCVCCRAPAMQIHHARYDIATLTGRSLSALHPVCLECHRNAERDGKAKTTLEQANAALGIKEKKPKDRPRKRRPKR